MSLTEQGFTRPSFAEIRAAIIERMRDIYGPINTGPESAIGQQISIMAERENALWDAQEAVYLSQYPRSAAGYSLDGAVQLTNIRRLPAARATVDASLIAEPGVIVPSGIDLRIGGQGAFFETMENAEADATNTLEARLSVDTVDPATVYSVTLAGTTYSITSGPSANRESIIQALQAEIVQSDDYDVIVFDDINLRIIAADRQAGFSVTVTDNLLIDGVEVTTPARAVDAGFTLVLSGTLDTIATPFPGLLAVTNYFDGLPGRDTESDVDLRIRQQESLLIGGKATAGAIRSRLLQNVEGVTEAIVRQNTTLQPESGIDPHNIEVIVTGGLNADVAQELWNSKAAGIGTDGEITEIVTDSTGRSHGIKFSRPVDLYIWVRVTLTINRQRGWPSNGAELVRQAVADRFYTVGEHVLRQPIYCSIYSVSGVTEAMIELATSTLPTAKPPSGSFVEDNIIPTGRQVARFDPARVEVIIND